VLDGVYRIQNGVAEFHCARSPTAEQLQSLLSRIIQCIMKALTCNGALIEEEGMSYLAEMETDAALAANAIGGLDLSDNTRSPGRAEGADVS
jgi:hypothetical protein